MIRADALNLDSDLESLVSIVRARTFRLLGDKSNASAEVEAAIATGQSDFVFFAEYDVSNLRNRGGDLAAASPLEDMQPLPRLDFLDPKYLGPDKPTPVVKMEEAHLIIAEAALASDNFDGAKEALANAVTLASSRQTVDFNDQDSRKRSDPDQEEPPDTGPILVQASPTSPALPNLAFPRSGNTIQVPIISGASLDPADIMALPTVTTDDKVELLRLIYLTRQEIFFFEGRRMTDLGIRRQINENEVLANEVITETDNAAKIYIPGFFPDPPEEIDRFDVTGNTIIIRYDLNQLLADNRNSHFGFDASDVSTALPFQFSF